MSRLVHRSVALALSLSLLGAATASAGVVPPFSDIDGHRFEADIEWMRLAGLTEGCGGGQFCPDAPVTRGQMASFLVRALALPTTTTNAFTDDDGLASEDAINRLAAAGITTGCAPTRFCPAANVTRVEMATFLARGFDLPLATRDWFGDDDGYSIRPTSTDWPNPASRAAAATRASARVTLSPGVRWRHSSIGH